MKVKGLSGMFYELETNPLSSGGEGSIYNVLGENGKVVKIYHSGTVTKELESKICYMVKNPPNATVFNQIAWPVDVVYDDNGVFCGFVMPRLNITAVLSDVYVYPPKYNISFKEKLILAQNICVVIHEIHKAGYVFGDFNPRNIGVNLNDGSVAFLDTDSYHIVIDKASGKAFRCNVCASGYAAPELLGKCYDYIAKHPEDAKCVYEKAPLDTFTEYTDNFALAIHVFRLLNNGYTPFNGVNESDTASVAAPGLGDTAVWRDSYCFKKGKKPLSKAVPPLDAHPSHVVKLFTSAFVDGRKDPSARPSAMDWYKTLGKYERELVSCSQIHSHMYRKGLGSCPWCEADARFNAGIMGGKISNPVKNPNSGNKKTIPVHRIRKTGKNTASASALTAVLNPLKIKDIVATGLNILGWIAFVASIIYVCMPLINNGSIHLEETVVRSMDVRKNVVITISVVFLLCFGSHFSNSPRQGLAKGLSGLWGWIFGFASATIYYVQLGYSATNASATWKFFGILIGSYIAAMVVGIRLGEWLSRIGSGSLFVKTKNKHKFKFYEILVLAMMIAACVACVPLLMNLGLFYEAVSLYNLVPIALWVLPVLFFILFNSGGGFGESTGAWFCAVMAMAFTVLVLWFGHVGGAGAVIGWLVLAVVALLFSGFVSDEINTGLSRLTGGLLFIVFIAGAYIDMQVLNSGVSSVGSDAHWWIMAPALITMVLAMCTTVKEITGY